MHQQVYSAFGLSEDDVEAVPFGSGLINHTWKIRKDQDLYILQRINAQVFKDPAAIAFNINAIAAYLKEHNPGYLFVTPVKSVYQEDLYFDKDNGYFRLSPFVRHSHTIDVVSQPSQAFEAAKQFGKFTSLLVDFDATQLKITLPDFHNLTLRYQQFNQAISTGDAGRINDSAGLIARIVAYQSIAETFAKIRTNPQFRIRATHHDTKISNVLFDNEDKGLCVIDLDTLMPGYFISDLGDMMRTYLSPVSEEEKDFQRIVVRDEYFSAILQGYLGELKNELTEQEKSHFVYAGKFMIYMQAIRFLTDHLNNDKYYGAIYEGHNFIRAENQVTLLDRLVEKEEALQEIVDRF